MFNTFENCKNTLSDTPLGTSFEGGIETEKLKSGVEKLIEKHFSVPHFDKTPENADTFRNFTKEIYEMIKKAE